MSALPSSSSPSAGLGPTTSLTPSASPSAISRSEAGSAVSVASGSNSNASWRQPVHRAAFQRIASDLLNHRILAVDCSHSSTTYSDAIKDFSLAYLLRTIHFPPDWISGNVLREPRAGFALLHVMVHPNLWHAMTSKIPDDSGHRGSFLQAMCNFFRVPRPDGGSFPDLFMTTGMADADRLASALISTRMELLRRT